MFSDEVFDIQDSFKEWPLNIDNIYVKIPKPGLYLDKINYYKNLADELANEYMENIVNFKRQWMIWSVWNMPSDYTRWEDCNIIDKNGKCKKLIFEKAYPPIFISQKKVLSIGRYLRDVYKHLDYWEEKITGFRITRKNF